KDDFLIYDRCGRLVYHLGLPYSFLHFQYVEEAIKIAYCGNKCGNCSYTEPDIDDVCENITRKADKLEEREPKPTGQHPHHHNLHRHGHHHRHHHRHGSHHPKNENGQTSSETERHHPHSG
ncbi:Selenoprotein P, partial [Manacus vitellinus]